MKRNKDNIIIRYVQRHASLGSVLVLMFVLFLSLSIFATPPQDDTRRRPNQQTQGNNTPPSQGGARGGSDYVVRYCYSEEERLQAIQELGPDPEITRFKGLGEISPEEFAGFIGPDIRLEQVTLHKTDQVQKLLEYYMGKNTMERQNFIIDNLVIEEDRPEEESLD